MTRRMLFALLCACGAMVIAPTAQSSRAADDPAAPAKDKANVVSKAHAPKGRLPDHYDGLVDETQRAKIYAIQAEHAPEIHKLEAAVKQAKAKRDAAVAAVLTPAQQEQLAKIMADSKGKKKGKAADMDVDDKPADADAPVAKKNAKAS